jgi:nicotinamidase-related amidase
MPMIDPKRSFLLIVDFQSRLMPVIHEGEIAVENARRLIEVADMLDIRCLFTVQNPRALGPTVEELPVEKGRVVSKQSFGACGKDGFLGQIPAGGHIVVTGCEAHVCVLQTALGLLNASRKVYVVQDAIGSRTVENKQAALRRLERHGAEIVTTEMVVFEWLQTADHPRFKQAVRLIK